MDHHLGLTAKERRWNCLIELAESLSSGKVRLEEYLTKDQVEYPHDGHYDHHAPTTIFKKGKRSPRRGNVDTWIKAAATTLNNDGENIDKCPSDEALGQTLTTTTSHNFPCKRERGSECSCLTRARKKITFRIPTNVEPTLPEDVKKSILDAGGSLESVVFLIEKKLSRTDVNTKDSRLSLPYLQLKNEFLKPNELEELWESTKGFPACLIQPCLEELFLRFCNWKSNGMYVLKNGWNAVSQRNGLNDQTVVRLWSFRRSSELCFALTKVEQKKID